MIWCLFTVVIMKIFVLILLLMASNFACSISLASMCRDRTIIAFGDSLTAGLYISADPKDKLGHHPYTMELQRLFRNTSAVIEARGVNGEKSTEMLYKLPTLLKEKRKDPIFVIILAGTNDLAGKISHKSIVWHLKRLHNAVQQYSLQIKRNIYTVAVSIPQASSWPIKESDRVSVNRDLKEYAERCNSSVSYLDLNEHFNTTKEGNLKLWSTDFVHFSKLGYDRMGHLLYQKMEGFAASKSEATLTTMDTGGVCV